MERVNLLHLLFRKEQQANERCGDLRFASFPHGLGRAWNSPVWAFAAAGGHAPEWFPLPPGVCWFRFHGEKEPAAAGGEIPRAIEK